MRIRLLAMVVVAALVASAVAVAGGPMTLLLARSHGRGSVTISAATTHLHGLMWLDRIGGAGAAHGSASVSCRSTNGDGMVTGGDSLFKFSLEPSGRQEIWRHGTGTCTVTVLLTGKGLLSVALRGY